MPLVESFSYQDFVQRYDELNNYARVFLAEGDSWFSYGSLKGRNLLRFLHLPYKALVVNIAEPGDTLRRMHETTRNPILYQMLRGGRRWDGIFLSGGGNDIIDAAWNPKTKAPEIFVRPADPASIHAGNLRSVIRAEPYADLLNYVAINVRQIVREGRDQAGGMNRGVPIFMHSYALAQPRNAPVKHVPVKLGPWLYPACAWLGIDERLWLELARILLTDLADTLKALAVTDPLPAFHFIDTLALTTSLRPSDAGSTGDSNDWENEIHPNAGGYTKLAATWAAEIVKLLP